MPFYTTLVIKTAISSNHEFFSDQKIINSRSGRCIASLSFLQAALRASNHGGGPGISRWRILRLRVMASLKVTFGGFLKQGYPSSSISNDGIFRYKPSSLAHLWKPPHQGHKLWLDVVKPEKVLFDLTLCRTNVSRHSGASGRSKHPETLRLCSPTKRTVPF